MIREDNHGKRDSDELLNIVYQELRQLAERRLAHERQGNTLTPTALVHETYLCLRGIEGEKKWDSEAHFFGAAAQAMRRILIDSARRKSAVRNGGELIRVELGPEDVHLSLSGSHAKSLLLMNDCLKEFEENYPEEAKLVHLRFFAGLTMEEAANLLGMSRRTAQRHWAWAKASLGKLMKEHEE